MDAMSFLKGLPAVLGIVGFFAYLWAGQYRIGGDLMKGVVEKLRAAPNVDIQKYGALTPSRIERLIQQDAAIRSVVNDQDVRLIRLIVILHNVVTIIILLVCAALVGIGIWLVAQPQPLSVDPHVPTAAGSDAGGEGNLLVDLDPVKAEWDTAGTVGTVSVFLENVESNGRTVKKTVLADVRSVTFAADEVRLVATERGYHSLNRIRTVVEWPGHTVRSEIVDIRVGIKVRLMLGGKLITPDGKTRPINTLVATIDDSTERLPKDYCFAVDFAGWTHTSALVALLKACNADSEVQLPFVADVDWNRHAGLVFNQPEGDRPLARLCISGAENQGGDC